MPSGVYVRTVEHKRKMSEAQKGRVITEEHKRNLSEAGKGRIMTETAKKKISEIMKLLYVEGKIKPYWLGKKRTSETKKKISEKGQGESNGNWKGGKEVTERKRKGTLKYKLNQRMNTSIRCSLKGSKNGVSWKKLVPYTIEELEVHLRGTIPDGYSWSDFLSGGLHIDHITPISAFNFDIPEHIDFKRCWALENLRLLPATENLKKHNKLIKPFQMALKIAI